MTSTLAAALAMNGDLADALATDQRALEMTSRAVGEDGEAYASVLGQMADTLVRLERPAEAIAYLDRALAIQTAKLGPGHVQTLTLMLTKCDALHVAGNHRAAIEVCERALAAGEASLGRDSPILFVFLGHLGEVQLDAGQAKRAIGTLERALALGANDPSDLYYIAMLDARAHWDTGDPARANELATKARDGFASLGDAKRDQAREVDAWLTAHAP